jgi:hypothetical protein
MEQVKFKNDLVAQKLDFVKKDEKESQTTRVDDKILNL